MKIHIRQAQASDLDGSYQVEVACFPENQAASKAAMQKRLHIFPSGYLVATVDDQVIGHINSAAIVKNDIHDARLKAMEGHDPKGKNLVIFSLAVHPDYQGKRIAQLLMNDYIMSAKDDHKESILLLCKEQLIGFYKRFGFVNRGVSQATFANTQWYEMALHLEK